MTADEVLAMIRPISDKLNEATAEIARLKAREAYLEAQNLKLSTPLVTARQEGFWNGWNAATRNPEERACLT